MNAAAARLACSALLCAVLAQALPPATALRFEDGTRQSGIDFRHAPHRTPRKLMPEVMGAGVVLADFNRDGAPDVLLVGGGRIGDTTRPAGAENRLYLNDGRGRFADRSAEWGLPSAGFGMGAAAGDFDNDGWVDLFLTAYAGPDTLLRNERGQRFVDVTRRAGLAQDGLWSTSAGFFDLEGDGDLDLFVVRYVRYDPHTALPCYRSHVRAYCTPMLFEALPARLWRNDGDGTFSDASAGVRAEPGKGLALLIGDLDQDGDADVFVANDTTPNHLWLNDGAGRLRESGALAGVALSETGGVLAGMGADMTDVDADGRLDLSVANFQSQTTTVYLQREHGVFQEVSDAVGVGETARARLSFGLDFFDADNDGDEDLLVANGHIDDSVAGLTKTVGFEQQNTLYELVEGGRFRDVSDAAGPALGDRQVSRGLASGDLDGDGKLDFVVSNNGGTAQVGRNATTPAGRFVSLWLEGRKANRSALGARVVARVGKRTLTRQVHGASSYLSMSDPRVHLGLGTAEAVDELTIHWPGSRPQVLRGLEAGRHYRIVEGQAPVAYVPGAAVIPP